MAREITAPTPSVLTSKSFDGKHIIQFSESSHRYKLDGKACTGVTTFIKASYPTGMGLIQWMKGQSINYIFDWFLQRGATTGITEEEKTEIFKDAKNADKKTSQEAADMGTVLHSYAEFRSTGKLVEADSILEQVKNLPQRPLIESSIQKYLAWEKQNIGELVAAESLVASPTYTFCGKFDLLSRRNGKLILSDYKTSKAIFLEHKIQLAAYRLAISEWMGMRVDGIEILRFGKNGDEFETELIDNPKVLSDLEAQALRCKATYDFIKEYEEKYVPKTRS